VNQENSPVAANGDCINPPYNKINPVTRIQPGGLPVHFFPAPYSFPCYDRCAGQSIRSANAVSIRLIKISSLTILVIKWHKKSPVISATGLFCHTHG